MNSKQNPSDFESINTSDNVISLALASLNDFLKPETNNVSVEISKNAYSLPHVVYSIIDSLIEVPSAEVLFALNRMLLSIEERYREFDQGTINYSKYLHSKVLLENGIIRLITKLNKKNLLNNSSFSEILVRIYSQYQDYQEELQDEISYFREDAEGKRKSMIPSSIAEIITIRLSTMLLLLTFNNENTEELEFVMNVASEVITAKTSNKLYFDSYNLDNLISIISNIFPDQIEFILESTYSGFRNGLKEKFEDRNKEISQNKLSINTTFQPIDDAQLNNIASDLRNITNKIKINNAEISMQGRSIYYDLNFNFESIERTEAKVIFFYALINKDFTLISALTDFLISINQFPFIENEFRMYLKTLAEGDCSEEEYELIVGIFKTQFAREGNVNVLNVQVIPEIIAKRKKLGKYVLDEEFESLVEITIISRLKDVFARNKTQVKSLDFSIISELVRPLIVLSENNLKSLLEKYKNSEYRGRKIFGQYPESSSMVLDLESFKQIFLNEGYLDNPSEVRRNIESIVLQAGENTELVASNKRIGLESTEIKNELDNQTKQISYALEIALAKNDISLLMKIFRAWISNPLITIQINRTITHINVAIPDFLISQKTNSDETHVFDSMINEVVSFIEEAEEYDTGELRKDRFRRRGLLNYQIKLLKGEEREIINDIKNIFAELDSGKYEGVQLSEVFYRLISIMEMISGYAIKYLDRSTVETIAQEILKIIGAFSNNIPPQIESKELAIGSDLKGSELEGSGFMSDTGNTYSVKVVLIYLNAIIKGILDEPTKKSTLEKMFKNSDISNFSTN